MFKIRKYHEKKVMSLTYDGDKKPFSVGILAIGEFSFGALINETYRVTSGEISFWTDESNTWNVFKEGEEFTAHKGHDYKLKAEQVSSYICFYD
jgi:uncharacterized protein YaiE (UPF0345 family)